MIGPRVELSRNSRRSPRTAQGSRTTRHKGDDCRPRRPTDGLCGPLACAGEGKRSPNTPTSRDLAGKRATRRPAPSLVIRTGRRLGPARAARLEIRATCTRYIVNFGRTPAAISSSSLAANPRPLHASNEIRASFSHLIGNTAAPAGLAPPQLRGLKFYDFDLQSSASDPRQAYGKIANRFQFPGTMPSLTGSRSVALRG